MPATPINSVAARWFAGRLTPLLALLAGGLLPLAFAPFDWAWLAVVAPAVLFAIGTIAGKRTALASAYLFGVGYYGVGVSWVYVSMGRYGDGGVALAVVLTIALALVLALFVALTVWLARWLSPRPAVRALVAFPAAWLLIEWVRTWIFTGFPWLLLGYSQTDTPLAGLAPVFGVLGIGAVIAWLAGLLAWLLLAPGARRGVALVGGVVLALGVGVLARQVEWTQPAGAPLKAVLLQGNIEQDKKWSPEWLHRTLDRYRELTEQNWGAPLIVWPEAAIPTWYHRVSEDFLPALREEGARHGSELIIGIPYYDPTADAAYNSVISVGSTPGVYHKRHLVAFGEYLPLRSVFGRALDILGAPMSDFTAGTEAKPLVAAGVPVGVSICYEAAFGPEIADALPQAQLLVNVSNDAWFGDSLAPHQHLQMARMRAIETGRYLLRATNTGITAVADEHGRIIARAPQFEIAALAAQVQPRTGATPYVRWVDWPVLGALAAVLAGLIFLRAFRRSG